MSRQPLHSAFIDWVKVKRTFQCNNVVRAVVISHNEQYINRNIGSSNELVPVNQLCSYYLFNECPLENTLFYIKGNWVINIFPSNVFLARNMVNSKLIINPHGLFFSKKTQTCSCFACNYLPDILISAVLTHIPQRRKVLVEGNFCILTS